MDSPLDVSKLKVLHVDNHVIAVVKPAGLLSQGDDTGDICLLDLVREWIRIQFNKPGKVFVGLVHRLDRPVSGVIVLGRTSKGASRLSEQFRERRVLKQYLAVVRERAPEKGQLVDTLDSKRCTLTYTRLMIAGRRSLLLVTPETGRKHQIRRQLSAAGHPIEGDLRYGAKVPLPNRSIALHALRLRVAHPTNGETLTFFEPPPPTFDSIGFPLPTYDDDLKSAGIRLQGVQRQ